MIYRFVRSSLFVQFSWKLSLQPLAPRPSLSLSLCMFKLSVETKSKWYMHCTGTTCIAHLARGSSAFAYKIVQQTDWSAVENFVCNVHPSFDQKKKTKNKQQKHSSFVCMATRICIQLNVIPFEWQHRETIECIPDWPCGFIFFTLSECGSRTATCGVCQLKISIEINGKFCGNNETLRD